MENCGASRTLRVIASPTARRIRLSGSLFSPAVEKGEADVQADDAAASTSSRPTRPLGPVPRTPLMSTPSSCARFRAAGDERTRSDEPSEANSAPGDAAGMPAGATEATSPRGSSAVSAINAITVATGALASAGNRMRRTTPEADASISMFALSVSTSKSTSPFSTRSPSFLCHATRRPSSIVSPSFGRITRVTVTRGRLRSSCDELFRDAHDVLDLRHDGLLEMLRVRDRRLETGEPPWRAIKMVEVFLGDDRGDLAAIPTALDRLMHDEQAMRLADRSEHRVAVERHQAAQVDDLRLDALGREPRCRFEGEQHLARPRHDREIGTGTLDIGLVERHEVLAGRHLAFRAVEELVFEEDDRVVVAYRGREETFRVGGGRRHHHLETGDVREPCLERLRVLRRVPAPGPALRAHNHRHARLASEHEPVLRRLVHELVHREP